MFAYRECENIFDGIFTGVTMQTSGCILDSLVMDSVPDETVLISGRRRTPNREDQASLESHLKKSTKTVPTSVSVKL